MSTKTDQELLVIYDALPALLDLAQEKAKASEAYVYAVQDQLRDEYRTAGQPFRWSMLYRSLFICPQCDYMNTQIKHVLENPRMMEIDSALALAELYEEDLHAIREHGAAFPAHARRFLDQFSGVSGTT